MKRKKMGAVPKERNGQREPGTFHKLDKDAVASKLATKTSSSGFAQGGAMKKDDDADPERKAGGAIKRRAGGAVPGTAAAPTLAKRARGGRTNGAPFSAVHAPSARAGASSSGHEGE